jgi:hypothetical protein
VRYRSISLLSAGHLFTDINQGAIPALLPFFIADTTLLTPLLPVLYSPRTLRPPSFSPSSAFTRTVWPKSG